MKNKLKGFIILFGTPKVYHPIVCTFTKESAKDLIKENKWKGAKVVPCEVKFL